MEPHDLLSPVTAVRAFLTLLSRLLEAYHPKKEAIP